MGLINTISAWIPWSRILVATKQDLKETENKMAIKLSELKGAVDQLRGQLAHIAQEQQTRYDELLKKFTDLQEQLEDHDLSDDVVESIEGFKADLQAFDDVIPDPVDVPPIEPPQA